MKTKYILWIFLAAMAGLIAFAAFFPDQFYALLNRPEAHDHALFVHVAATTLFFANAVVGMLWERRSLASGRKDVILHTYETVAWLDARFSSPLILLSLVSGLMLGEIMGGMWEIGWLSAGFLLFLLSGLFWVVSDIPTQYRLKRLLAGLDPADPELPGELMRLLGLRWWISLAGVLPLAAVFALMVYKPDIPPILHSKAGSAASSVSIYERVELSGLDNAVLIRGEDPGLPLLLWLHGGPGAGQIHIAHRFFRDLEGEFLVVNWDQPGAGKSNPRNLDAEVLGFERYLSDAHDLTGWLKNRFPGRRIFLLGHSWGSQLGARLAARYPEDYAAYIGVSQVVNAEDAEKLAHPWLLERIRAAGRRGDLRKLERLGAPPYERHDAYVFFARLVESYGGGSDLSAGSLIGAFLSSPEYRLGDLGAWLRGANRGSGVMWPETRAQDLRIDVPRLGIPAFFLSGVRDQNTPFELVREYVDRLEAPGKELVLFESSAHTPFFAEPERFARELSRIKRTVLEGVSEVP